jgi:hypothetical protein
MTTKDFQVVNMLQGYVRSRLCKISEESMSEIASQILEDSVEQGPR